LAGISHGNHGPPDGRQGLLDELPGVIAASTLSQRSATADRDGPAARMGGWPFPFDELGRLGPESRLRLNYQAKGFRYPGKSAG